MFAVSDPHQGGFRRPVRLFDADPDLLSDLHPSAARVVRETAVVESLVVEEGPWAPPSAEELGPHPVGLLVLDGLLSRTIRFDDLESPALAGTGDVLRPWQEHESVASLEFAAEWRVLEPATLAVLDGRFARRIAHVPGVIAALLGRTVERSWWLSFQLAIAHVRRTEPRVLMLLWHLADRWGRVTPAGTVVPLRLTHATIADLVCMRRPTVSATLARLARAGEVVRNGDGTWTLTGAPPDLSTITRRRAGGRLPAA